MFTTARLSVLRSLLLSLAPALLAGGCGASPPTESQPSQLQHVDGRTKVTVELEDESQKVPGSSEKKKPPVDPRNLPSEADFARLVKAANQAEEYDLQASDRGCLLAGGGKDDGGWRLAADLAGAVRPLPDAPSDLKKRLQQKPGRLHVLTRWGRIGEKPFDIALVAFTTTTPATVRMPAVALLLTASGIFVRESDAVSERYAEPFSLDELGPLLAERAARGPVAIYVTAEAAIRLDRVRELLSYLPERNSEVALAVPLASGTRLPSPSAPAPDPTLWCPDGLPPPAASAAVGDIEEAAVREALGPLTRGAQKCMASLSGEAAAGGKVQLSLRIGGSGRVEDVCLTRDEIQNALLARCLVETARGIAFPAPEPAGLVDVHLPLRLAPTGFERQRAICR